MKNIFPLIILLISLSAAAQKTEQVTDSSKTKLALFSSTLRWITKTWGDADKVTSKQDQDAGIIVVKGGLKSVPKSEGFSVKGLTLTELTFTITEGNVKMAFEHTGFKWDAGTLWNFEDNDGGIQKEKWKADVLNEINGLVTDYKSSL